MNQAQVVHASWVHRDPANLSLLEACHADTRDSVVLAAELKQYERGTLSVGTGPSSEQRKKRQEFISQAAKKATKKSKHQTQGE